MRIDRFTIWLMNGSVSRSVPRSTKWPMELASVWSYQEKPARRGSETDTSHRIQTNASLVVPHGQCLADKRAVQERQHVEERFPQMVGSCSALNASRRPVRSRRRV